ncbi:MAG TPA: FAD-binding oxidoreductase [Stellaceae bacterium]|nr:FAD-binding oxidoreductase [Stellaceae bacterium]
MRSAAPTLPSAAVPPEVLDKIRAVVGPRGLVDDPNAIEPYLVEARGLYHGATALVVRPGSTEEVAEVVRLAAAAGVPVVPQGGNTGLVGGGVPWEGGRSIIIATGRMNRIRAIDPGNYTMTVEAGCILANLQSAAAEQDRLFPLSLGAEGTCQIGGNLSTNAGGIQVLRYGNTRDLVLGIEVVLADGRIWNGLRTLRKDNTGYDLKNLFVGAEGTLGIITAATLRLFPKPREVETALLALNSVRDAMELFTRARIASGDQLTAFELMPRIGVEFALKHTPGLIDPIDQAYPHYALIEMSTSRADAGLKTMFEAFLADAMEAGLVVDGVIAASAAQVQEFWRMREGLVEGQRYEGGSIKHDVSVPVSSVAEFIERATEAVTGLLPGIRPVAFGHAGDGNIHFNLTQPLGADTEAYLDRWMEFNHLVHDIVASLGGSISAEHGVGRLKRDELIRYKSPVELDLMARIKQALDPHDTMNPGKVVPRPGQPPALARG